MLPFESKNIEEFVENWNKRIPIDRWYRKKYNIPFNSPTHRAVSLLDMFFEFWESVVLIKSNNNKEKQKEYIKGEGNFMKEIVLSQKDIDTLFDEINIDDID